MRCGKIRELIEQCVDGAASEGERETVDGHVAACDACRRALEQAKQLALLLGGNPQRAVSESFESRLLARVQETAPRSAARAWWQHFRLRFEWRLRVPSLMVAGSLAAGMVAVAVSTQVQMYQAQQSTRRALIATAIDHHEQLERSGETTNWEAVDASIDLNTGEIVR